MRLNRYLSVQVLPVHQVPIRRVLIRLPAPVLPVHRVPIRRVLIRLPALVLPVHQVPIRRVLMRLPALALLVHQVPTRLELPHPVRLRARTFPRKQQRLHDRIPRPVPQDLIHHQPPRGAAHQDILAQPRHHQAAEIGPQHPVVHDEDEAYFAFPSIWLTALFKQINGTVCY